MSELFALGPLFVIAVFVIAIFLVLGVFYVVQRQAEKAVRSPEYWDEEPDGRRYPTGWGDEGGEGSWTEGGSPSESKGSTEPAGGATSTGRTGTESDDGSQAGSEGAENGSAPGQGGPAPKKGDTPDR